jgi:hypothetical protein
MLSMLQGLTRSAPLSDGEHPMNSVQQRASQCVDTGALRQRRACMRRRTRHHKHAGALVEARGALPTDDVLVRNEIHAVARRRDDNTVSHAEVREPVVQRNRLLHMDQWLVAADTVLAIDSIRCRLDEVREVLHATRASYATRRLRHTLPCVRRVAMQRRHALCWCSC